MDDEEFHARFWTKLGTNYCNALEVFKSLQGKCTKPFLEMLDRLQPDELSKTLESILQLRDNVCLMLKQPNVVAETHRLAAYSGALVKKQGKLSLSKAERKERKKEKDLERKIAMEEVMSGHSEPVDI